MHEKQMHRYNCYITLTLNNKNLPSDLSLDHSIFQRFLKRTRKALSKGVSAPPALLTTYTAQNRRYGVTPHAPIKYYMCGEYGEKFGRPHYHAILFGLDFNDKKPHSKTPAGYQLYTSPTLDHLWGLGFTSIGDATFESAAYIARYIMKKRTGDGNVANYKIIDPETGEIYTKKKEYNTMSRQSGIGSSWIEKYASDVYAVTGKVIVRGHQNNPPRYYDQKYKNINQAQLEHLKHMRYLEALTQKEHHTPERLAVQEQVAAAKTKTLQRKQPWEST